MIVRQDGVEQALAAFPFLNHYFRCVGLDYSHRLPPNLYNFQSPVMSAYYINLLLISAGAHVGRHVDATLMRPIGISNLTPSQVMVLHLQQPRFAWGGRLNIYKKTRIISSVSPRQNQLITFRGDLAHSVSKLRALSQLPRASLVCEQYLAPRSAVMRLEPFTILSKAGFATYLDLAEASMS